MERRFFDTYLIKEEIGSGSYGRVYLAYHKRLEKDVVIKRIPEVEGSIEDHRTEVDLLKNLKHSCLPQVYDLQAEGGDLYIVEEFIPGNSFKEYLDSGTIFEEASVLIWAKKICETLQYLHGQNPPIIHCDLKPANIILMPDGNICLIDFNISMGASGNAAVMGYTEGYASPEQIYALRKNEMQPDPSQWIKIDTRADIYSFGACIYHMLSGHKPVMQSDGRIEDIRETGAKVSDVFAAMIMKCLEQNPDRRYQSAGMLLEELDNFGSKKEEYRRLIKKQHVIYAGVVGGLFLFLFLAIYGYFRRDEERTAYYNRMVALEKKSLEERSYELLENYYQSAVETLPERLEAYYQKALSLYAQQKYGEDISFIQAYILQNSKIKADKSDMNDTYYLLGNCYEKMENYEFAADSYRSAIECNPKNPIYYRDYSVMLAKTGDLEKASAELEAGREKGLSSETLSYVEGEISFASEKYEHAKDLFQICLEQSKDEYLKMRCYISIAQCIEKMAGNTTPSYQEEIKILEQGIEMLSEEYQRELSEMLAATYANQAKVSGDDAYYEKAAIIYRKLNSGELETFQNAYNLAMVYINLRQYTEAKEKLFEMEQSFGEDYRIYKAFSFLELSLQSDTKSQDRNYLNFQKYYNRAKENYNTQIINTSSDPEMDRLEQLYQQVVENGWI